MGRQGGLGVFTEIVQDVPCALGRTGQEYQLGGFKLSMLQHRHEFLFDALGLGAVSERVAGLTAQVQDRTAAEILSLPQSVPAPASL